CRIEKALALACTHLGQLLVLTRNQAFAWKALILEGEEVALIKQAELQGSRVDQRPNATALERRHPGCAFLLAKRLDLLLRYHPAIADDDEAGDPEVLLHALHLVHRRGRVRCVALVRANRYRATAFVGEQSVVDLKLAALAIAVVPKLRQRARVSLEVARGQVVQDQPLLAKMSCRKALLDGILAFEQPVHGLIQVVLGRVCDSAIIRQRRRVPRSCRRKFALRICDSRYEHRDDQVALSAWCSVDQPFEPQLANRPYNSVHRPVRLVSNLPYGPTAPERLLATQDPTNPIDLAWHQRRQVGQSASANRAPLAVRLAQQDRRRRRSVRHDRDVHATPLSTRRLAWKALRLTCLRSDVTSRFPQRDRSLTQKHRGELQAKSAPERLAGDREQTASRLAWVVTPVQPQC